MATFPEFIQVVDSHTEGEPTRVVVAGWPPCAGDTMAERRESLRRDHDHLRQAVVCEPRGHDAIVGALLTPAVAAGSAAGVIFFNNTGYLGMCGHGLIGVVRTLEDLGLLESDEVRVDTPVGTVGAKVEKDGSVTIRNVPSRCKSLDVEIEVPGLGRVSGDVAWGGNWFFLTTLPELKLTLGNLPRLLAATQSIRTVLDDLDLLQGEGRIDHVELFEPAGGPSADSRNFVLCPGGEYDRSPCGTGTSAKLAALHARGDLAIGQEWRQESITGGRFVGWLAEEEGKLVPHIRGRAWVTSHNELRFSLGDPFRGGFSAVAG